MIENLFTMLKKPALWQTTGEPFWDDEHISKSMLEAHLNPDWEAASRTHEFIERSVKWLSTVIPAGSKILDLGCGPGLYTARLSNLGYDVTGMDFSRRSIAYAKEHDKKTKYIYQNYLELDYTEAFDAITLIYCDYAALTQPDREVLLSKVYKALKPNGLFLLDVFTDASYKKKSNKTHWSVNKNGGFWSPEPHICLDATYLFEDNMASVDQSVIITASEVKEYLIWDTCYTKESLSREIMPWGFSVVDVFSDFSGRPYTENSEVLCMILAK